MLSESQTVKLKPNAINSDLDLSLEASYEYNENYS